MIPAMKKEGYDAAFSSAITSISSTIGPIMHRVGITDQYPYSRVGSQFDCKCMNGEEELCSDFIGRFLVV